AAGRRRGRSRALSAEVGQRPARLRGPDTGDLRRAPREGHRQERRCRADRPRRRLRRRRLVGGSEREGDRSAARTAAPRVAPRGQGRGGAAGGLAALMQIGAHISSAGGIDKAIDRAADIGADSVQVFTQSPRTWRPTNHDPASFDRFREKRAEAGIGGVLCHALYLCNLASPDDTLYEKSVLAMGNTLEVACGIGADGAVFHVGSHLGSGFEAGLERVLPALEVLLELCSEETWLLMENSAGAGGTIGRSVDELATLWERLDRHP